jgi:hypothetical protein
MVKQIKSFFPRIARDYSYYRIGPGDFTEDLCASEFYIKATNTLKDEGWDVKITNANYADDKHMIRITW